MVQVAIRDGDKTTRTMGEQALHFAELLVDNYPKDYRAVYRDDKLYIVERVENGN